METLWSDIGLSLRQLRRRPFHTLVAVSTLTFGIAASISVFAVVDTVFLKPLPFADPDRLVVPVSRSTASNEASAIISPVRFQHLRDQSSVLEYVAGYRTGPVTFENGDYIEQLQQVQASSTFFPCYAVPIAQGRAFTDREDMPNGPRVVLISQAMQRRHFEGEDVLGKSILLGGHAFVVVGVVDSRFDFRDYGPAPDVFVPLQLDPATSDLGAFFYTAARLKHGVTLEQARARLEASNAEFRARFPGALPSTATLSLESMHELWVGHARPTVAVLSAAAIFVLLIACANVSNLLLLAFMQRAPEISVRMALGATRLRIGRQLITESFILSIAASALGLILGYSGLRALLAIDTGGLPRVGESGGMVGFDWRVALFSVAVALCTALVVGTVPVLLSTHRDIRAALSDGSERVGRGSRNKIRAALVIAQVGAACVLLIGGGLLVRSFLNLASVNPGFDAQNVLLWRTPLTGRAYETSGGIARVIREVRDRVGTLPGVDSVTAACCAPMEGTYSLNVRILGRQDEEVRPIIGWLALSPGYFELFRIPVKSGRVFSNTDSGTGPPVVVINEAMAKQFWGDSDPIGDRIVIGEGVSRAFDGDPPREIIGIVGDIRDLRMDSPPRPTAYVPQAQIPDMTNAATFLQSPIAWIVRTKERPSRLIELIHRELGAATGLPVTNARTMDEIVAKSVSRQRLNSILLAGFSSIGLLMAVIGIYGQMAHAVQQRKTEIGIRLALGAQTENIRILIATDGMALAIMGAVLGFGVAFLSAKLLGSLLFGVEVHDSLVFAMSFGIVIVVTFLAAWIPATKASRLNPLQAIRRA